jgi:HEAT repeat protein
VLGVPDLTEAEARGILEAVKPAELSTLVAVQRIRDSEPAVAAAAKLLATPASPEATWAAASVYAAHGPDAGVLAKLLDDASASLRLLAARGLVQRGDRRGFAPLAALLEDDAGLDGSSQPVWVAAAKALALATGNAELGPPFDADPELRARCAKRWHDWLGEHGAALTYAPERGEWDVP